MIEIRYQTTGHEKRAILRSPNGDYVTIASMRDLNYLIDDLTLLRFAWEADQHAAAARNANRLENETLAI